MFWGGGWCEVGFVDESFGCVLEAICERWEVVFD